MTLTSRAPYRTIGCFSRRVWITVVGVLLTSCSTPIDGVVSTSEFFSLHASGPRDNRLLRLDAVAGARINALLPPSLELTDGQRVSFAADSLTADSSYFAVSPTSTIDTRRSTNGTLRASVCPASVKVCLSVKLNVVLR